MAKYRNPEIMLPASMLYTANEVRELIERQLHQITREEEKLKALYSPMKEASRNLDIATMDVFKALIFIAAPDWKVQMKKLEEEYNAKVKEMMRAVRQAANDAPPDWKPYIAPLENRVIQDAARINDALNKALMESGDGGAALNELRQLHPDMEEVLDSKVIPLLTDQLARDRRFSRAKVYIGVRCNLLERQGIKATRDQWKTIYTDLRKRQNALVGEDEIEAWNYLKWQKPMDMIPTKLRDFEKEISRFKQTMKHEADRIWKSRQSGDKES